MDENVARIEIIEGQIRATCEALSVVICALPPAAAARAVSILEASQTVAAAEGSGVDSSERADTARDAIMDAFVRLFNARTRSES
ncbi:hypothetical protein WDZ92_20505 [Nostoc sp. NIES-2111]